MRVIYRKGLALDGAHLAILSRYGSYGLVPTRLFAPEMLAWYERWAAYACAGLRSGGEYGRQWHPAGLGPRKENTITDFIDCRLGVGHDQFRPQGGLGRGGVEEDLAPGDLAGVQLHGQPVLVGRGADPVLRGGRDGEALPVRVIGQPGDLRQQRRAERAARRRPRRPRPGVVPGGGRRVEGLGQLKRVIGRPGRGVVDGPPQLQVRLADRRVGGDPRRRHRREHEHRPGRPER